MVDFEPALGSEANKTRPAVVVSSSIFDALPVRIVVPLTEWCERYRNQPNKVRIARTEANGLYLDSAADVLLLRSVAVERFADRLGVADPEVLADIVTTLAIAVDMPPRAEAGD